MPKGKRYDEVWCVVMFDLPTDTPTERREATRFRKMLIDEGFAMIQYSVYGKYSPSFNTGLPTEKRILAGLPPCGEVRIFHLTDNQWAKATRFRSKKRIPNEKKPVQLSIFETE